jgi:hypothetical protein
MGASAMNPVMDEEKTIFFLPYTTYQPWSLMGRNELGNSGISLGNKVLRWSPGL